jgi:hypothetical protein
MSGIQFFEAQIDDQLLPRHVYDDLLTRHGFTDLGSARLTPCTPSPGAAAPDTSGHDERRKETATTRPHDHDTTTQPHLHGRQTS